MVGDGAIPCAGRFEAGELFQGLVIAKELITDVVAECPVRFKLGFAEKLLGGGLMGEVRIFRAILTHILIFVARQ